MWDICCRFWLHNQSFRFRDVLIIITLFTNEIFTDCNARRIYLNPHTLWTRDYEVSTNQFSNTGWKSDFYHCFFSCGCFPKKLILCFMTLSFTKNLPIELMFWFDGSITTSDWTITLNPLSAKFFRGNINIYLHFVSFLHIDMIQVLKILPQVRQGPTYDM